MILHMQAPKFDVRNRMSTCIWICRKEAVVKVDRTQRQSVLMKVATKYLCFRLLPSTCPRYSRYSKYSGHYPSPAKWQRQVSPAKRAKVYQCKGRQARSSRARCRPDTVDCSVSDMLSERGQVVGDSFFVLRIQPASQPVQATLRKKRDDQRTATGSTPADGKADDEISGQDIEHKNFPNKR